jgi:hypothetical protein
MSLQGLYIHGNQKQGSELYIQANNTAVNIIPCDMELAT